MSTRAEQIAAVKRVIDECGAKGYDDFPDDPHTFGHLTSMRAVLATLEGMAAPGENERAMEVIRRAAALIEKGDSPSPQQPTQDPLQFAYNIGMPKTWVEFAAALDRFAAHRVTAAPVSGDARTQALSLMRSLEAAIHPAMRDCLVDCVAHLLTAATDKARREAIEECLRLCCLKQSCGDRIRALTSGIKCAIYSQVPPYRMRCEKCLAAGRCLDSDTPQNPGDAAPESE